MSEITSRSYVKILEKWIKPASKYFYTPENNSEIMCYGTGESHHWAVQTNMNSFAALAVLSMSPELDEKSIGMSRKKLQGIALKMLRYSLKTHHTGNCLCSNNKKWGHSWISVLALERMMHGFEAIQDILTDEDKLAMREILESESDNLLDNYKITAGIDHALNKPESNIWNGSMLLRTAMYYPDTLRRNEYLEKATSFFVNGISIPSDKDLDKIFNGKSVKEWHIGPNFTKNYSLNHHDYMNIGYMVICMSNIAMLHFSLKKQGIKVPDEVYFHAEELWNAIKQFIFSDGRLLRIGGDNRARYCYCQDYAVPMWLFVLDQYKDTDALQFESGWLKQVMKEVSFNSDNSFLSTRLDEIKQYSPYYYTRLEGDRAVTMSYGAYWRHLFKDIPEKVNLSAEPEISWQDEFHGASMVRNSERIASWVWAAGQRPTGLFIPPDKSNMAEWQHNLSGEMTTSGNPFPTIISNEHEMFAGGFVNSGCVDWTESRPLGEGEMEDIFARHGIAFAALPDNKTAICLQYAKTTRRICLQNIKGLGMKMPNDLFNDLKRNYFSAEKDIELSSCPGKEEVIKLNSSWLNIDNCLSVFKIYGDDHFTIYRPAERQIKIKYLSLTSLYADEICTEFKNSSIIEPPEKVIIDTGAILFSGINSSETRMLSNQKFFESIEVGSGIRTVKVTGADNVKYLFIANFTTESKSVDLTKISEKEEFVSLSSGKDQIQAGKFKLNPFTAQLFKQS
jgi:hypothetical protein